MIGSHPGGIALTRRLLELAGVELPDKDTIKIYGVDRGGKLPGTERDPLISGYPEKVRSVSEFAENQYLISGFTEYNPSVKILDLGAGTGETVSYLRKLGYDAFGIEQNVKLLFQASVAKKITVGDMTALSFPDESFDLCMAECSISVCGDGPAALKEAYRVLRPGGSLLLSDVCFSKENAPCLSMSGPVTKTLWEQECVRAGFVIRAWKDETPLWREFFLESLWNDNADEAFCDFFRDAGKAGCGYFLAWLLKGGRDGFI